MASKITTICDVCGAEMGVDNKKLPISVVFNTEQTEGRLVSPYLSVERLDLCDFCMNKIIQDMPLRGSGAQGYNKYSWK